jgi:hypothetical protein
MHDVSFQSKSTFGSCKLIFLYVFPLAHKESHGQQKAEGYA